MSEPPTEPTAEPAATSPTEPPTEPPIEPRIEVRDAPERSRYEVSVDGTLAGFSAYQDRTGVRIFTHTEIEPPFEGRGVGSALARGALADVRVRGIRIVPICPFISAWIRRHPEEEDLIARREAAPGRD